MTKTKKIGGWALVQGQKNYHLTQLGQRVGGGCQYVLAIFDSKRKAQKERGWMESEELIVPCLITLKVPNKNRKQ